MSLRVRLVLMQVALTVLLLGGVSVYLASSFQGWTSEALDETLQARVHGLAGRLELEHGEVELEGDDEDWSHTTGPFRVSTARGRVLLTRGFARYAEVPVTPGVRTVELADGATVRVWTELVAPHERRGHGQRERVMITVVSPTGLFDALSARFLRGVLGALGLGALLGAAGAWVLAGLFLAPVHRLAAAVAGIEAGSLHQRVDAGVSDPDLGRLTAAFNAMLDRLEASFERQRAFVARASHALRTPLATVLAQTEVALRRDREAPAYRAALEDIAESARASGQVVEGLLAASRADAARERLRPAVLPVAPLLDEVRRLFALRAEQAELTLEVEAPEGLEIHADPGRLRELLAALLDNALRYTPKGGRVGLRAEPRPGAVRVEVWDTGPGVEADERGRIFERFQRGRAAERSAASGSGLGLAVVAALAEAHRARVSVEDRPGGGARFLIEFPDDLGPA